MPSSRNFKNSKQRRISKIFIIPEKKFKFKVQIFFLYLQSIAFISKKCTTFFSSLECCPLFLNMDDLYSYIHDLDFDWFKFLKNTWYPEVTSGDKLVSSFTILNSLFDRIFETLRLIFLSMFNFPGFGDSIKEIEILIEIAFSIIRVFQRLSRNK